MIDTFYKLKLSHIFALVVFKMATNNRNESEELMTEELREKYQVLENKLKEILNKQQPTRKPGFCFSLAVNY